MRFFNLLNMSLTGTITLFSLSVIILNEGSQNRQNPIEKTPVKNLICVYTKNPIIIDAKLNEKGWKSAKSIIIDGALSDRPVKSDNKFEVKTLWDEQNLYIAFQVQDKNLQAKQTVLDHPQLSLDDIVEFLIDTRNDKDSCWTTDDVIYHINLLNQKKDDRGTAKCTTDPTWNGNAKTAVQLFGTLNDSTDIDKGYIVEISISWSELNVKPFPDFKMGIDFANGDSGIFFDWAGASPFRSPYAFGNLILMK